MCTTASLATGSWLSGRFHPFHCGRRRTSGWLLHWDATLRTTKLPGPFGWDNTPTVVPASLVPSYTGTSTYLLGTKFNSYANVEGGTGLHRLVLLDPDASEVDPRSSAAVMKVVMFQYAPTPDPAVQAQFPDARKEWCTNSAVVDLVAGALFVNNEDGICYRWDLASNTLSHQLRMSSGRRQAYTPTLILPLSGEVVAVNWATLNVMGRPYEDVTGDDAVDVLDVVAVLDRLGSTCSDPATCPEDVNGDGTVDRADLDRVRSMWGRGGC